MGSLCAARFEGAHQEELLHARLVLPVLLQVPNAVLVDIKGSAGGCSCIASSRDGRWLVAACADAAGRFKVRTIKYDMLVAAVCLWPADGFKTVSCALQQYIMPRQQQD